MASDSGISDFRDTMRTRYPKLLGLVQLLAEAGHGVDELRDDVRPLAAAAGPDAAQAWNIVSLLSSDASTLASSRKGCDEGCQQRKQHLHDQAKRLRAGHRRRSNSSMAWRAIAVFASSRERGVTE